MTDGVEGVGKNRVTGTKRLISGVFASRFAKF